MTVHQSIRVLVLAVLVGVFAPALARAQSLSLSITPDGLYQDECYTITVPGGANLSLDLLYYFNGSGPYLIPGWPNLDPNGQAYICTDLSSPPGDYYFHAIRPVGTSTWSYTFENVSVWQKPLSFSFSANSGHAGNDSYTVTVGNGANMFLDLIYTLNGTSGAFSMPLDANGQWSYTLHQSAAQGPYTFVAMKNSNSSEWIELNPPWVYTVLPPRPTWSSVDASSVQAGTGAYTLRVGNTADINLDSQYWYNGGVVTVYGYPDMVAEYPGSPDGKRVWNVSPCHPSGVYAWLAVRHPQESDPNWWQGMPMGGGGLWVTVTPPPVPVVSSVSPSSGTRQTGTNNVNVTLVGSNLCNLSLQTSWQGLTFDNIQHFGGSSASAMFHIASTSSLGAAAVTLNATGGSTTFNFPVISVLPTVTGLNPASGVQGTNVQVAITGTNLTQASLSTTWNGLTFSNVSVNQQGTTLTAMFNILATAPAGSPPVKVTTPNGDVTTSQFSISSSGGSGGAVLTREYIYLGDRVIAVDSP